MSRFTDDAVRQELADIVNFWREKGVRGFRFDVINLISKAGYPDDPNNFDGRQYYTDGPRVHEYLKELNKNSFGQDPDILTVGEMSSTTLANCVQYAGKNTRELNSVFTFYHLKADYPNGQKWQLAPPDLAALKQLFTHWQQGMIAAGAQNALFWNNHDQPRANSRFGDPKNHPFTSATLPATCVHLMHGIPYIYQGEELGMTNAGFTELSQYQDVESINAAAYLQKQGKTGAEILAILAARSRDNARTPMQWNASPNAGFTTGTPWLPVNANHAAINAAAAIADPNSVFHYYRRLIELRKTAAVIQHGGYQPLLEDHPQILAYQRTHGNETLRVYCNFSGEPASCQTETAAGEHWQQLIANSRQPAARTAAAHPDTAALRRRRVSAHRAVTGHAGYFKAAAVSRVMGLMFKKEANFKTQKTALGRFFVARLAV